LIGITGRAGGRIDAIGFITAVLENAIPVSVENTIGYWGLMRTANVVEHSETIHAETTKGKEIT